MRAAPEWSPTLSFVALLWNLPGCAAFAADLLTRAAVAQWTPCNTQ